MAKLNIVLADGQNALIQIEILCRSLVCVELVFIRLLNQLFPFLM